AGRTAFGSLEVIATVSLVLMTFQLVSTALTITLKAVPAVCTAGVPVLPVALPGAAVSPGTSSCSRAKAPGVTVIAELVSGVLPPSVLSEAVSVWLPMVFSVTLNVCVPEESGAAPGSDAKPSLEAKLTVSVTVVTGLKKASTALTVMLNGAPDTWDVGVPALPVAEPGAALWPGTSTCNRENAAVLTAIAGLVLAAMLA